MAFLQVVQVVVVYSIDSRGVFDICTSSISGCGGQY